MEEKSVLLQKTVIEPKSLDSNLQPFGLIYHKIIKFQVDSKIGFYLLIFKIKNHPAKIKKLAFLLH
jgi:hypothetical protein